MATGTGLAPSNRARRHIFRLSRQGVGRRALSAASDVSAAIIVEIKSGRRTQIRKRTQERILEVSHVAVIDAAVVSAGPSWKQIRALLSEGFTKAELARRLGFRSNALQLGKTGYWRARPRALIGCTDCT
jgi:hypothetical protein